MPFKIEPSPGEVLKPGETPLSRAYDMLFMEMMGRAERCITEEMREAYRTLAATAFFMEGNSRKRD